MFGMKELDNEHPAYAWWYQELFLNPDGITDDITLDDGSVFTVSLTDPLDAEERALIKLYLEFLKINGEIAL